MNTAYSLYKKQFNFILYFVIEISSKHFVTMTPDF